MKNFTEKQKMRIAVAKDVISRIQLAKLRGIAGEYIARSKTKCNTPNQAEERCKVCAIGAAFLSYVRLFNGTTKPLNHYYGGDMYDLLEQCFSGLELNEIEDYFECLEGTDNDTDRILMIMQNIVDGKGKFDPSVEYEIVMK